MIKKVLHAVILLLASSLVYANDELIIYSNIENPSLALRMLTSLKEATFTDATSNVISCMKNECIKFGSMLIAKPKIGESGTYMGNVVHNEGLREFFFLGKEFSVEVVTTEVDELKQKYFFSTQHGLIAFKLTTKERSAFFLLRGEKGIWFSDK